MHEIHDRHQAGRTTSRVGSRSIAEPSPSKPPREAAWKIAAIGFGGHHLAELQRMVAWSPLRTCERFWCVSGGQVFSAWAAGSADGPGTDAGKRLLAQAQLGQLRQFIFFAFTVIGSDFTHQLVHFQRVQKTTRRLQGADPQRTSRLSASASRPLCLPSTACHARQAPLLPRLPRHHSTAIQGDHHQFGSGNGGLRRAR